MKKKIILLGLGIFVMLSLLVTTTYAWLTSSGSKNSTYTVGNVTYTFGGDFLANNTIIVPGQELLSSSITTNNSSTVASNVRVKIAITIDSTNVTLSTSASGTATDAASLVKVGFNSTDWVLDTDGCLYYKGKDSTTGKVAANTALSSEAQTIITSIVLNGATVGNAYAGKGVSISISLQAKQADYVTWDDLATINFETGLAA
jgi:hypothetical protein